MTKTDEIAIRQGVRHVLNRREAAWETFVDMLSDARYVGNAVDARKVAGVYSKLKALKYDGSTYTVKHGAFLDRDVLQRALAEV